MKYIIIILIALSLIDCKPCPSQSQTQAQHLTHITTVEEKEACKQWNGLCKEIKELYYLVLTKPSWYQGSNGRDVYFRDCKAIDKLHLKLYQQSRKSSTQPCQVEHWVYIECARDLFIASCQGTINRQLPEYLDEFHSTEQKKEMSYYRKEAIEHLDKIKTLLDKWIQAREQYAKAMSNKTDGEQYIDRASTDYRTSSCLMSLSEIISLP